MKLELNEIDKDVERVRDQIAEEVGDKTLATKYVLGTHPKARKAFVEYLSDGMLTKVDGKVVDKQPAA